MDQFEMLPFAGWQSMLSPLSHTSKVTTEPIFSEHQGFGDHVQDYLIDQHESDLSPHTNNPSVLENDSLALAQTPTLNSLLDTKDVYDFERRSEKGPEPVEPVSLKTKKKLRKSLQQKKSNYNLVKSDIRKYTHHTYSKETFYKGLNLTGLCTCPPDLKDKEEVPDDQVFIDDGQMCRLQDVAVIKIGHLQMHAFMKNGNLFVPKALILGHFSHERQIRFKQAMLQYNNLKVVDMGDYDLKLIKQKYNLVIKRSMQHMIDLDSVRVLANLLLKEQDDPIINILANEPLMLKVDFSNVRCSECRLKIAKPEDSDQFSILNLEPLIKMEAPGDTEPKEVEVTIGELTVNTTKFASFQMQDKTYISMKEFVSIEILSLASLQRKCEFLNYIPIITPPEIAEIYDQSDMCVSKSLWMDLEMVMCVCKTCNLHLSKHHELLIAFTMKNYSYTDSIFLMATDTSRLHDKYSVDYDTIQIDKRLKNPLSGVSFEISNHPNPKFRRNNLFRTYGIPQKQGDVSTKSQKKSKEKSSEKDSTSGCLVMNEMDTIMLKTGEEYIVEDIDAFRLAVSTGQVHFCAEDGSQTVKTGKYVDTHVHSDYTVNSDIHIESAAMSAEEDAHTEGFEIDSNKPTVIHVYEQNLPSSSVHSKETLHTLDSLDTYPAQTAKYESDLDDQPQYQLISFKSPTGESTTKSMQTNSQSKSKNQTHTTLCCSNKDKSPEKSPSSTNQTQTSAYCSNKEKSPVKSPSSTSQTPASLYFSNKEKSSVKSPSSTSQTHTLVYCSNKEKSPVKSPLSTSQTPASLYFSNKEKSSVKSPSSTSQTHTLVYCSNKEKSPVKSPSSTSQTPASLYFSNKEKSPVKSQSSTSQTHTLVYCSNKEKSPVKSPSSTTCQPHTMINFSNKEKSPVKSRSTTCQPHTTINFSNKEKSPVKSRSTTCQPHTTINFSNKDKSPVKSRSTTCQPHRRINFSNKDKSPVKSPSTIKQTHENKMTSNVQISPVKSPSRVDKMYSKIAAMMVPNSSNDNVTPLNMLATIATTEEVESDHEGELEATMKETKNNSDKIQVEYSEEDRRRDEETIKKYVVFFRHGTRGIRVKRFKKGAEQAFPALFSPSPDHPVAKDLRSKFMIYVCKWITSNTCKDRNTVVENANKLQDSVLGKNDQIMCTGNGRDEFTSGIKKQTKVVENGHDKTNLSQTMILKDRTKTTLEIKTSESHEVGNEISEPCEDISAMTVTSVDKNEISEPSEDISAMTVTSVDENETSVLVYRSQTELRNSSVNNVSSEEVLKRKAMTDTCRVKLKRMKILEDIFRN